VLLFGKLDVVRLRYLTSAFRFRERAALGYLQVTEDNTKATVDRFQVDVKQDTLLLFQEDSSNPVARLSMSDLPTEAIVSVIEKHQFLQLPRLSSQKVFNSLCPEESSKARKRLCVVLLCSEGQVTEREGASEAMREFVRGHRYSEERVRFTYVLLERQNKCPLTGGGG